jgi:hypothetical protein
MPHTEGIKGKMADRFVLNFHFRNCKESVENNQPQVANILLKHILTCDTRDNGLDLDTWCQKGVNRGDEECRKPQSN